MDEAAGIIAGAVLMVTVAIALAIAAVAIAGLWKTVSPFSRAPAYTGC